MWIHRLSQLLWRSELATDQPLFMFVVGLYMKGDDSPST